MKTNLNKLARAGSACHLSKLLTAALVLALALTFGCSSGDGSNGSGGGTSKSSCISAELEIKANTLDDVREACNAIRSEVLAQLPDRIGSCNKNNLAFDKPISELTASCGVAEIPATSSSSSFRWSSSSVPTQTGVIYGTPVTYGDEIYQTVVIGTQTWMARNLNYNVSGSKCYDNDPSNCTTYGRMYNLVTAMEACPSGWHLPTKDEWDALTEAVGGSSTAARYLKATSGWFDCGPVGSGSSHICEDKYGFTALPGGYSLSNGYSSNASHSGLWWSATKYNDQSAYRLVMDYHKDFTSLDRGSDYYSVRCLKN